MALGSGGARGYAHIGVLDVLVERGYEVVAIAGSSMGAVVGGVFAAGKLDEYRAWVTGIGQFEVLRLLDLALSAPGALRGERVFSKVRAMLGDCRIEDLQVPYTAVAADLIGRREVWFQRGSLDLAMRASGAIPSIFPPVEWNGRLLADGGLLNPVPIAPLASAEADVVIGVSLHGDAPPTEAPADETGDVGQPLIDRIRARASRALDRELRSSIDPEPDDAAAPATTDDATERAAPARQPRPPVGKFDVVNLALDTMQAALTQHKLAGYRPDVLVTVPKTASRSLDFHRAAEMIGLGRRLTEEALDRHDPQHPQRRPEGPAASAG